MLIRPDRESCMIYPPLFFETPHIMKLPVISAAKNLSGGMRMFHLARRARALGALALAFALAGPVCASAQDLVPVGETVGIEAATDGLLVASLSKVETAVGECCPSADAGILPGDIIIRVGSTDISCAEDFANAVSALNGESAELTVMRDEKTLQLSVTPVQDTSGAWRLGLWLRSGVSGIGTVTYYDPATGEYGALGHSINDADTGVLLPISEGSICDATVSDVKRGERGEAGELRGSYDASNAIGTVEENTTHGIFGTSSGGFDGEPVPVASPDEITDGPAVIRANVSGDEVCEYDVEISRDSANSERLLVTVTDPELLSATGGIVQGMSGSPILQDGKLIGAVTHVLISDPTRGYGVTISAMLDAA